MMGGEIVRAGMGSVTVARMLRLPGAFAAAASLLLSAALLLAPGAARAANECGTLSGTPPSATCTATSYANGIQYLGVSGGTVVVPGAGTAWTVTSGTGNWGSGIVLDTDNPGASDTTARNIALTVGGASATNNRVAIGQRGTGAPTTGNDNNNGIRVNQQGRGTSTTTVTVHEGVTIGTSTTKMTRYGIDTKVFLTSGAASVTNAADIYSTLPGIYFERHLSADTTTDTTLTNSGDITASAIVIEMRYRAGDATNTGGAKITNTGALVKHNTGFHGAIEFEYQGTGNAEVDNKGDVTAINDGAATPVALTNSYGIHLRYLPNTEASVTGSGTATIRNTHAVMSVNDALRLINQGLGAATIVNSGALTTTGTAGTRKGIWLQDSGTTTAATTKVATVTNSGAISANEGIVARVTNKNIAGDNVGISITHSGGAIVASGGVGIKGTIGDLDDTAASNTGDIDIAVTGGSVQAGGNVLEAAHSQAGDIDIRVSGGVTLTSTAQQGIFANLPSENTVGGITIDNAGTITAPRDGIFVRRSAVTGASAISVTNSGDIKRTGTNVDEDGILVEETGVGVVTVTNSGAIGEATVRHRHGIRVEHSGASTGNTADAGGGITITNSGAITSRSIGIDGYVHNKNTANVEAGVSITHSDGAINVSEGGGIKATVGDDDDMSVNAGAAKIAVTGGAIQSSGTTVEAVNSEAGDIDIDASSGVALTSANEHVIFADMPAGNAAGGIDVTSGATITGPKAGIYVRRQEATGAGAVSVTNSGDIRKTGEADWHGILINDAGTGNITVTNSGDIGEATLKHNAGIVAEKTAGATGGDITITNSGAIMAKTYGIYPLDNEDHTGDITVTNSGDITAEHGIFTDRSGNGALTVTSGAADKTVSGGAFGIHASHGGTGGKVKVTHTAGAVSGRTGILAEVTRASGSSDTRLADANQPLLEVTWTDGTFTHGTGQAADDTGRFAAATAARVIALDREAAAQKAVAETVRYGAPAGIEARVLDWDAVVEQVATGDAPDAFADNAAQMAAVPTGATTADNAYVAQFRAALGNDELSVASGVLTAIDSSATSMDDISDAEIVTYLRADNAATRTLLRNILAQGLSNDEKDVLRATTPGWTPRSRPRASRTTPMTTRTTGAG